MTTPPVLDIAGLHVTYANGAAAVRGTDLTVSAGEALALVGESGCGKTTVAQAILGLLPRGARATGRITLAGRELLGADRKTRQAVRGDVVGHVGQDPFTAFDPRLRVGTSVAEAWRAKGRTPPPGAVVDRLTALGIPDAEAAARRHPHTWSGGMLQRAAIAAATAHDPALVVADEPTSALDADLADATLTHLRATGAALLLITHDLRLAARHADRVAVMYAGHITETAPAHPTLTTPRHPYTRALIAALPHPAEESRTVVPGHPAGSGDAAVCGGVGGPVVSGDVPGVGGVVASGGLAGSGDAVRPGAPDVPGGPVLLGGLGGRGASGDVPEFGGVVAVGDLADSGDAAVGPGAGVAGVDDVPGVGGVGAASDDASPGDAAGGGVEVVSGGSALPGGVAAVGGPVASGDVPGVGGVVASGGLAGFGDAVGGDGAVSGGSATPGGVVGPGGAVGSDIAPRSGVTGSRGDDRRAPGLPPGRHGTARKADQGGRHGPERREPGGPSAHSPGVRLPEPIPGEPPSALRGPDTGCAFAPRCALVTPRCHQSVPVLRNGVACGEIHD